MEHITSTRPLFDESGRFIPRRYEDGRGMLSDRLGLPVQPDFRAYVRQAAKAAGVPMAHLIRQAVEAKAAEILASNRKAA